MMSDTFARQYFRGKSAGRLAVFATLISTSLVFSPVRADLIPVNPAPPALAEWASATEQVYSRVIVNNTFYGSVVKDGGCVGQNSQMWNCRDIIDSQDSQANSVTSETNTSATVSATRDGSDFGTADYAVAEATARAQTNFGSNKAEARASAAGDWIETRVDQDVPDPQETYIDGTSSSFGAALSRWTEVITATADGVVKFVFSLTQHAGELIASFGGIAPGGTNLNDTATPREGYGFGEFIVQLFDLGTPTTYGGGEQYPIIDGYALVGEGALQRDASDPNETVLLEVILNAVAGRDYSLVSQLSLEVGDNAWLDLFGTASLDRIEVAAGQQLTFASGTAYNVVGPTVDPDPDAGTVPEPGVLMLSLAGLLGMAATTHLRRRREAARG